MTSWHDRPVIERWSHDAAFVDQLAPPSDTRWSTYFAFDLTASGFCQSPQFFEWHQLTYELGLVAKFDYAEWMEANPGFRTESLDVRRLPVAEAIRLLTFICRADRFSEGTIEYAIETRRITGIVEVVKTHIEARSHDDGSS